MGDEIETIKWNRLEPNIARPDGGIRAVQMPCLHDLDERRDLSQRVDVGVLLHVFVVGVAVLDGPAEQRDGSFRKLTPLRLVLPGKSLRCQGTGTGGIVVQHRILGLLLEVLPPGPPTPCQYPHPVPPPR